MCSIAEIDLHEFFMSVLPMFIALLLVLLTIAFVPSITLWLPNLIMGH
jgi:TRAP-type C4-dicarboxylate transport system permease large subunit